MYIHTEVCRYTKAGDQLECTNFIPEHNQETSDEGFKLDPTQRRVDSEIQEQIAELAQAKMPSPKPKPNNYNDKHREIMLIASQMANYAAKLGTKEYEKKT